MKNWLATAIIVALPAGCAPSNERVARVTTESGAEMSATYSTENNHVSVSVAHAMPSISASGNQDQEEIEARAGRMREFARSRAQALCRDGVYEVLFEELGAFGGLVMRTLSPEAAAMARNTTLEAKYYCTLRTLGG